MTDINRMGISVISLSHSGCRKVNETCNRIMFKKLEKKAEMDTLGLLSLLAAKCEGGVGVMSPDVEVFTEFICPSHKRILLGGVPSRVVIAKHITECFHNFLAVNVFTYHSALPQGENEVIFGNFVNHLFRHFQNFVSKLYALQKLLLVSRAGKRLRLSTIFSSKLRAGR